MTEKKAVLITGASTGIGAVYAERFARRGHDLVLVARNRDRMTALAERLADTGVGIDLLQADLNAPADLAVVATRLREDDRIGVLVNNAGISLAGGFVTQPEADLDRLIATNVTAVTRLARAAAERFAAAGDGAIINIASVIGLAPETGATVYGASKAFVLFLSQGLAAELASTGVYVQAVVPGATRTAIWGSMGLDVDTIPGMMEIADLVDAALVGFDRREGVTIPPLPDVAQWEAMQSARQAMLPNFGQSQPAERYRTTS
ncbi:SDR family oxidoreductase [Martelella alba]|uniref:SDR family oxidoreductase n=1 Tax=Martelella alba TaxID=2590451 RepID=A0A506U279_9HYPH|nr:SDR family oxidoreductase [Martelella alba]TPW27381.1 SDR family oxidoreductase [Martelella alba]